MGTGIPTILHIEDRIMDIGLLEGLSWYRPVIIITGPMPTKLTGCAIKANEWYVNRCVHVG